MKINYLYINETKITLINISHIIIEFPHIYLDNKLISTHELRITITDDLTTNTHINEITKEVSFQLINLCKIRNI